MNHPFSPDYRISDAERQQAMEDLGNHFAAGRLDVTEYDQRLTDVANAVMKSDLDSLFDDLPTNPNMSPARMPGTGAMPTEVTFTASEIDQNYRSGRNMKLGIVLFPFVMSMFTAGMIPATLFALGMALSAALFLMLYVMKLGPKSWHQPSVRQLERQRHRQIMQAQAMQVQAMQLANAQQIAQQRAIRQQKQAEIAAAAMEVTNEAIQRWRRR
ncbi:MAG: DUF1707 domain-containing protein [Corynebacterium sp.]|nr:DUF1707 domain-containing protein [Corynebacterium sp.]